MRPVFLIGFMGAGKTTVGRTLAARSGRHFADLDEEIVRAEGTAVAAIFEAGGEAAFRASERRVLRELARDEDGVIACGGGVVTDEESRAILKCSGTVVYLAVSPEEAVLRIGAATEARPLLPGELHATGALMAAREPLYAACADFTVDTSGRSAERVAQAVAELLDARS